MTSLYMRSQPPIYGWLDAPKTGKPVNLRSRPNIFLVPVKTPYPKECQESFPEDYKWTIDHIKQNVMNIMSNRAQTVRLMCIELSEREEEGIFGKDWVLAGVDYRYVVVSEAYPPSSLREFCSIIEEIPSPGPIYAVMIYCKSFNRTGFAIAGTLMWCDQYTAREACAVFTDSVPPGIFSAQAVTTLNSYDRNGTEPAHVASRPCWTKRFDQPSDQYTLGELNLGTETFATIKSGHRLSEHEARDLGTRVVRVIKETGYRIDRISIRPDHRIELKRGFMPTMHVYDQKIHSFENQKFVCSYQPRGCDCVVLFRDPGCVYIEVGRNQWFKVAAEHSVPRETYCLGRIAELRGAKSCVMLTDVILYDGKIVSNIRERMSRIWYDILDKMECHTVEFRMRAVTELTRLGNLPHIINHQKMDVVCDGIVIMPYVSGIGVSYFIPQRPTLRLYVVVNTYTKAFLQARDAYGRRIFVAIWTLTDEKWAALDGRLVRFEIQRRDNDVVFIPLAQCHSQNNNDLACDSDEYAKGVIRLMKSGVDHLVQQIKKGQ